MASTLRIVMALSLLSLLTHPSFSQTTCKSQSSFSNKKTFDNCNDLPTLNAALHWTYDSSKSSLSMAFTAPPPTSDGWVAWALNPKGTGMVGAQALIAFKPSSGPISVNTYDLKSYQGPVKGPISYNVTAISAEESAGKITIFATWALPKGNGSTVNQVWQVGPVVNGQPGKHGSSQANLASTNQLSLASTSPSSAPAGAPAGTPAGAQAGSPAGEPAGSTAGSPAGSPAGSVPGKVGGSPAPATEKSGAVKTVLSLFMVLGAIVVSLF